MSEVPEEHLTIDEIRERLRTGWNLDPRTPNCSSQVNALGMRHKKIRPPVRWKYQEITEKK